MTASTPAARPQSRLLAFASIGVAIVVSAALLWAFHDRYWYPTDDGLYAHIAERLLHGEVLQRDVQDIHPGPIHFVHAAAFRLFGVDLVSLRYPLVAAAFGQAMFALALVGRRDVVLGAAAGIATVALGVVQFVDPTPNWYCLTLVTILAVWMTRTPVDRSGRLVVAGVLTGRDRSAAPVDRRVGGDGTAVGGALRAGR